MSNYVGIRGWSATVLDISPAYKNGSLEYVSGHMKLLPYEVDRDIFLGGKNLNLDVYFHCYTAEVAQKFFNAVSKNDTLIVSGDLSQRDWVELEDEPNTNFWLDEFVVDPSKHRVAALCSKIDIADTMEYAVAANHRYSDTCIYCKGVTLSVATDERKYCPNCDD